MTNALSAAVEALELLPEADQENIGRQVLQHVEKLRVLRADVDAGIRSFESGAGQQLEIDDVIAVARHRHGKR